MALKYRTKGFTFKKSDRAEADRNFSVFTQDYGRLEVLGRAIRKINSKLRAGIDIFYFSEIEFIQGKNYKTLTDTLAIKKNKNTADCFKIFCQISNVLDKFLKGQEKDQKLFDLLGEVFFAESLPSLGWEKFKNKELVYYYFLWNFFSLQGYHSEVQMCVGCHEKLNPNIIYFSFKDGGTICGKCLEKDKFAKEINADIVKTLRIIFKKDWQLISKLKIEPASQKLFSELSESAINQFCPS